MTKDRATKYAHDVLSGEIVAGPHVRASCQRHLNDLEKSKGDWPFAYDESKAKRVIDFFEQVLYLNGGEFEGKPFKVLPWQAFILGSLFGWVWKDTGYRRFNISYIETAKGSGKSPIAAGIGIYGLVSDGESRAEIYAAATKADQAKILFRDAVAMVRQSHELASRLAVSGGPGKEWNISYIKTNSFFRAISSGDGQSGPRPHIALLDEVHEHRDNSMVEMMRAGRKSRKQMLAVMITNSGNSKQTVGGEYHDTAISIASGQEENDSFFCFVCAHDEDDDYMNDESTWEKSNPSLGAGIPTYQYIRDQVTDAKGMPSKLAIVQRLNFCVWVSSANPFISADVWMSALEQIDPELLEGRTCWGGLDLGSTLDLSSAVLVFDKTEDDPVHRILPFFWIPGDTLMERKERDRVPVDVWVNNGDVFAPPGRSLSRAHMAHHFQKLVQKYNVLKIGYDRNRIEEFKQMIFEDDDLDDNMIELMEEFGQGYKSMSPAIEETERLLLEGELKHNGNPCLTWNAANAVAVQDPTEFRKLDKTKAYGRIDGMIALVEAVGTMVKNPDSDPGPIEWITVL